MPQFFPTWRKLYFLIVVVQFIQHTPDDRLVEAKFCAIDFVGKTGALQMASVTWQSRDVCALPAGIFDFACIKT